MKTVLLLAFLLVPFQALGAQYGVDHATSTLRFSGTHAGVGFSGRFGEWSATIRFDETDLPGSRFTASFKPASAKTGNRLFDGTLPGADWFDTANHPQAQFVSTSVTDRGEGSFAMTGDLTIRGITRPISFSFMFGEAKGSGTRASATFEIDRLAFDLGKKSDGQAEWVSRMITLQLDLHLMKK